MKTKMRRRRKKKKKTVQVAIATVIAQQSQHVTRGHPKPMASVAHYPSRVAGHVDRA